MRYEDVVGNETISSVDETKKNVIVISVTGSVRPDDISYTIWLKIGFVYYSPFENDPAGSTTG